MRKNVYIDPRCLATSIIPSVLEEYHKETSGYLIGSNGAQAKRLRIVSAYYMQTDKKNPTWVEHGNASAVKRIDGVMKTMKVRLVGGFHTHPGGPNKLSKSDISFIREKIEDMAIPSWLELIVSVKKKEYESRQKQGWFLRNYSNKLGMTIRTSRRDGYAVTLSGFWVSPAAKRPKEATLWTSQRYNF